MSDDEADEVFRSRWITCDDCGCSTTIENEDDPETGVPDENDWAEFGRCLVCGSSQLHWNADPWTASEKRYAALRRQRESVADAIEARAMAGDDPSAASFNLAIGLAASVARGLSS